MPVTATFWTSDGLPHTLRFDDVDDETSARAELDRGSDGWIRVEEAGAVWWYRCAQIVRARFVVEEPPGT